MVSPHNRNLDLLSWQVHRMSWFPIDWFLFKSFLTSTIPLNQLSWAYNGWALSQYQLSPNERALGFLGIQRGKFKSSLSINFKMKINNKEINFKMMPNFFFSKAITRILLPIINMNIRDLEITNFHSFDDLWKGFNGGHVWWVIGHSNRMGVLATLPFY